MLPPGPEPAERDDVADHRQVPEDQEEEQRQDASEYSCQSRRSACRQVSRVVEPALNGRRGRRPSGDARRSSSGVRAQVHRLGDDPAVVDRHALPRVPSVARSSSIWLRKFRLALRYRSTVTWQSPMSTFSFLVHDIARGRSIGGRQHRPIGMESRMARFDFAASDSARVSPRRRRAGGLRRFWQATIADARTASARRRTRARRRRP